MKTTVLVVVACFLTGCTGVGQKSSDQHSGSLTPTASNSVNSADVDRHPEPAAPPPADERVDVPEFKGTAGITDKKNRGMQGVAVLSDVRSATHGDFDRVVFEFEGIELPGYHIEYVDKPVRSCGSGDTVPMAGDGWLEVRFSDAQAHTAEGQPTIRDRSRSPGLPIVKDLKITCDFEAEVTWVMGVSSPNPYRVIELKNPTRLVVDINHK